MTCTLVSVNCLPSYVTFYIFTIVQWFIRIVKYQIRMFVKLTGKVLADGIFAISSHTPIDALNVHTSLVILVLSNDSLPPTVKRNLL